ncbi:MAG: 4-(cytidine 5'-diphospho)-2-C-methyl-D-erythritol kinase [Pirellulales bacterium]
MYVHRRATGLEIWTPGKLNLFFEVLAKRSDGFHEIETLMCPINLYDTLYFREGPKGQVELQCEWASRSTEPSGSEIGRLPEKSDNIVVRAVQLLRQVARVASGAVMRLVKRIPIAAGLGGGSSDAAAALAAANLGWGLGWSQGDLSRLAAELGSDVPFFLNRGPAVCRGRGEQVQPLAGLGTWHFVVVRPPAGLSTASVYRACRPAEQPRRLAPLLESMAHGRAGLVGRFLHNRLQPVAESLSPWIERLKDEFNDLDCLGHQMSGSGTCYFGLCRHARHARRVAGRLQTRGVGAVYALYTAC